MRPTKSGKKPKRDKHAAERRNYAAYIKKRGDRCEICEVRYPIAVYHLHHKDPAMKTQNMDLLAWTNKRVEKTIEEAEHCALVCANCHIMEHCALRAGYTLLEDT